MMKRLLSFLLVSLLSFSLFACDLSSLLGDGESGEFTPTVYTEVVKDSFEKTYADQLSPNEKAIYDAVVALPAGTDRVQITFPEVPALCRGRAPTDEEMNKLGEDISRFTANALYAAWLDTPTLFWLDHGKYSYNFEVASDTDGVVRLSALTLSLTLTATPEEIEAQSKALTLATAGFLPLGKTAADKVAYINSYLAARIEYDLNAANRGSVIGALVDGKCVCEGYARAFDYLCDIAGVDAVCVPGYGITDEGREGHMWNAVTIDGKTYAVDATWNDTTGKNAYLLVGTNTVCNGTAFGKSHEPNMLTLEGPHKQFALPKIEKTGYGIS